MLGHDTIKLLEENIDKTFFDINHSNIFLLWAKQKGKRNNRKNKQMGPNQT